MKKDVLSKILRWAGYIAGGLIVLVALVFILLPLVGGPVAGGIASGALNGRVTVGRLSVNPLTGHLRIADVSVQQPPPFDTDQNLLTLESLSGKVSVASLFGGPVRVRHVAVDELIVNVQRDTNGVLNVEALIPEEADPEAEAEEEAVEEEPAEETGSGEVDDEPMKTIAVMEKVEVRNIRVYYRDEALANDPVMIAVDPLELTIENLDVVTGTIPPSPPLNGRMELRAFLKPEPGATAPLGVLARVGPVGSGVPDARAAVRLVGLDLAFIEPLLPPGVVTTIGGRVIDVAINAATQPTNLAVALELRTASAVYKASVKGPPDQPEVNMGEAFANVLNRFGGVIGNIGGNTLKAGAKVAGAAVKVAGDTGKNVGKLAFNLGAGIGKTASGLLKGDLKSAGTNLLGTVEGAAKDATSTVTDAAGAAASGAGEAVGSATGGEMHKAWDAGAGARWSNAWVRADAWVEQR